MNDAGTIKPKLRLLTHVNPKPGEQVAQTMARAYAAGFSVVKVEMDGRLLVGIAGDDAHNPDLWGTDTTA